MGYKLAELDDDIFINLGITKYAKPTGTKKLSGLEKKRIHYFYIKILQNEK